MAPDKYAVPPPPQRGDKLFRADLRDWINNACLNNGPVPQVHARFLGANLGGEVFSPSPRKPSVHDLWPSILNSISTISVSRSPLRVQIFPDQRGIDEEAQAEGKGNYAEGGCHPGVRLDTRDQRESCHIADRSSG